MPHGAVAAEAGDLPPRRRMRGFDGIDNFLMTVAARVFGDLAAVRKDLNVVGVAAGGEKERMPEAVRGFRVVFADQVFRRVAAIAGRDRAVRSEEHTSELQSRLP